MKALIVLLFLGASFLGDTQNNLLNVQYDSLRSDYRIDGDFFALENATHFFDAAFINIDHSSPYLSTSAYTTYGSKIHQFRRQSIKRVVSPLPHVGFGYTFGLQGAQRLVFEYQQAFKGDWILNTKISNVKSLGYFRNMELSKTDILATVSKMSERFGISLTGRTSKLLRTWSGGVIDASLLEVFAPLTVPVNKSDCNSELRYFDIEASGFLTIIDNERFKIGISNALNVNGENRLFDERDTLAGLYSSIYFDSLASRDQYQIGRLENNSAFFFKNDFVDYSFGLAPTYWNYRNMNLYRDTFELDFLHDFQYRRNRMEFRHEASLNTIGASKSWSSKNELFYHQKTWSFALQSEVGQELPELYQRFYSANNTFYDNTNMNRQSFTSHSIETVYAKDDFELTGGYQLQTNDGIYFYDKTISNWSNETALSSSIIQRLYLKSSIKIQKFIWKQEYQLTNSSLKKYIVPLHQLNGSIMTRLGLFKAKKLKVTFGLSYRLNSKTNVIPIIENIGIYDLLNASDDNLQNPIFTMGAMLGMEIETFRFFVKFSNMGYLWNSPTWQYIQGIYLPETTLRVGLTWDFWN